MPFQALHPSTAGEVEVTVPERRYDFTAQLLVTAIEELTRTGEPAGKSLLGVAGDSGRSLGSRTGSLEKVLEDHGFEPRPDGGGVIVLGNCPFHQLAQQHTDTVCHLNLELLRGVTEGSNDRWHTLIRNPGIGRCCVRAVRRQP